MSCPLCETKGAGLFFADTKVARADFHHCAHCDLIFKSPEFFLEATAERDRYALHNNLATNEGYVRFLQPVVTAVEATRGQAASGLDYGCGPGPVLCELLRARGFQMNAYDPYFAPDESCLSASYDFVTCTEVAEHFYRPREGFARLMDVLKPTGTLFIMTGLHRGREAFSTWRYRIDPTHVCFYSRATLEWIAKRYAKRIKFTEGSWPIAVFSAVTA